MARSKVLLKEPVDGLGVAGDVKTVARGFARNYLLPNNLAIWATPSALKQADEIRRAGVAKLARLQQEAHAVAEVLGGSQFLFEEMAGDTNRLYGSVTAQEIEDRIRADKDLEVDRRTFLMDGPIRQLGVSTVRIRLMQDIETTVEIGVVREGETWAEAVAYQAALEAEAETQANREARVEAEAAEAAEPPAAADADVLEVLREIEADTAS